MGNYPHVLVVPSWYPSSERPNLGIFFKEQAQALKKQGVKIGVVYSDIKGISKFSLKDLRHYNFKQEICIEDGIPTIRFNGINFFPGGMSLESKYWVSKTLKLIDKYISEYGKPDIIHAHSVLWGGYTAFLAGKKYGIPYVITEHSSSFARRLIKDWKIPYIRRAFEGASQVIAVSSAFREILSEYAADKPIEVIPNMVDTSFFTEGIKVKEGKHFSFFALSFLTPGKCVDNLIRAFANAFGEESNVDLYIGGDGVQRPYLENLCSELKMQSRIHFLGQLARSDVREYMLKTNVFVHPSGYETFGVVLIEAMACGLPVIATRCGGPEDIVISDTGELVEPGNVEALGKSMKKIYLNYSCYDYRFIRRYAEESFGYKAVADRIISLYSKILNK